MDATPDPPSPAEPGPIAGTRVYRASPRTQRQLLIVFSLVMLLPGILVVAGLAGGDRGILIAGVVTGLLMSAVMLPIFWLTAWRFPRLVLTETGVEVHQLGMRLTTAWNNVAALRGAGGLALVLHEPMTSPGAGWQAAFGGTTIAGAPLYGAETRGLIAEQRYMPLAVFAYWLQHGDLAAELNARAPWLSPDIDATMAELSSPRRRPWLADADGRPLPRKNLVAIVVVIALSIALAVAAEVGPAALKSGVGQLMSVVSALALSVYSVVNFVTAARCLRRGQTGPGLLWGTLAVVTALTVLAIVGSMLPG